ncbi:MAG TPA: DUF1801 domain-containing protein [Phototrophicaceae bacterium]|nr:DUF1801 domain-containing protein [Phototrophicaceae bacterium]
MTLSVESFLATYSPEVRAMAEKARALVLDVLPDALEMVDEPAKMIGYGTSQTYTGLICTVMPYKDSVNLGFARGAELPDPAGLLQGTGKKARHVKFKQLEDIDNPAVRDLLEAAKVKAL